MSLGDWKKLTSSGDTGWTVVTGWQFTETNSSSAETKLLDGGLAPPTAPVAALRSDATAGQVDAGAHLYKVEYVTADGDTLPSVASNSVTNDGTHTSNTVTIPVASGNNSTRVTARKIFRTQAAGSSYTLLATVSNNTATTYTDILTDASIVGNAAPATANGSGVDFLDIKQSSLSSVGDQWCNPVRTHAGYVYCEHTSGTTTTYVYGRIVGGEEA